LLADPQIGSRRDHLAEGLRVHFYRDDALYYRHSDIDVILERVVLGCPRYAGAELCRRVNPFTRFLHL
jgi:hypothetical protein